MNFLPFLTRLSYVALLFSISAILTGCGGGGGSASTATTTLDQSTIQLPTQVQVVSSK